MIGKILSTGTYIPKLIWDNHKITEMVDTTEEWIEERTGIKERHISKKIGSCEMAVNAAKNAISNCKNFHTEELDVIIVCSTTSDIYVPSMACVVQNEIQAKNAFALDMNAACSGFVFAYQTVLGYMSLGVVKKAMIIGTEQLSRIVDWKDRSSCILFGDGAGAVILEAIEGNGQGVLRSDGSLGGALECKLNENVKMDGQKVFRFAVKQVPEVIKELMRKIQVQDEDIDYYVLHQANLRIIEAIGRKLRISERKIPRNIQKMGNTSSASIPILLDEMNCCGMLKEGTRIILAGFGAGLTWGAAYIEA